MGKKEDRFPKFLLGDERLQVGKKRLPKWKDCII